MEVWKSLLLRIKFKKEMWLLQTKKYRLLLQQDCHFYRVWEYKIILKNMRDSKIIIVTKYGGKRYY